MSKDFKDVLIENWIIKDENKNLITEDENKWVIENDGTLTHTGIYYPIVKEQLLDKDWIIHLMNKSWVDLNHFIPKYFEALKRIGAEEVTITVNY